MSDPAEPRIVRPVPADSAPPATWPLLRRLAGEHAEERVYRVLAFALLPGGVLFGLLGAPSAVAQADLWPLWWSVAAFAIGIVPSLALGVAAFTAPLETLRLIARISVAGTLLVLASIPFVVIPGRELPGPIWFADVCGLGIITAALAVSPFGSVLVAVAGAVLAFVARIALGGTAASLVGAQSGLYLLLLTITFIALGVSSLHAARAADAAEAAAEEATVGAAADAARERERARINELVHDRVLATLLSAARQIPGSGGLEQRDARRALDGLHALLRDDVQPEDLAGERFVWKVQARTTDLLPEALFNYELGDLGIVPGDAADSLLDAAEEAMRNSLRHAGPANRTVHVDVAAGRATIDVLDDGVGFERAAVPPGRLGLSESIEGRMRMLAGGSALIISQPGVGTRVSLRWRAP
ncbi:sensor histidine kinase [uncultured Amnibacterium sp.]|uniref:sensor histidine kinase n=1 Tax=uncultured Amnibacterium sp. TaxID=1631851 RepID=UPI0035C9AD66